VVIAGTLPELCHAQAMAATLRIEGFRLFDYARFAEPLCDVMIRTAAERFATENELQIECIRRKNLRKEERVRKMLRRRGDHPGLVHIFSAMVPYASFRPWHDKSTHQTFLKGRQAKCLHYYFYFVDKELGLCYLRVPIWAPFRLQYSFNGHNWPANQLDKKGIRYTLADNSFTTITDFASAQRIADSFSVKRHHRTLDRYAHRFCPALLHFRAGVHWSLMQVEYATDIVFRRCQDLQSLYDALARTTIHAAKADNVATFLGRKLNGNYQGEVGNDFHTCIEGTRIRHHMGPDAIKMHDKHGRVLRIETTANKVSFFKHHRVVEHRDGTTSTQLSHERPACLSMGSGREQAYARHSPAL